MFNSSRDYFDQMVMGVKNCCFSWTKEEDKAFENALATLPDDCDERWEKIADKLPGKTIEEIKHHYELLVEDISCIESGQVPMPCYPSMYSDEGAGSKRNGHGDSGHGGKLPKNEQERRKGIAWTEEEHRLFLLGLEKFGKGDWRSISRNFVVSRTPTQVASHAQKYFIRLNSVTKDRRRTSIHDITNVNGDISAPQGPVSGLSSGSIPGAPLVNVYGTTIGPPFGNPLISAMTTQVPAAPVMPYGVRDPVSATPFLGTPMNISPNPFAMPPTSYNR